MKKTASSAIISVLLAQNPVFVFAAGNASVRSVRVSSESVYITTDRPVKYRVFNVSRPPRVVIELDESRLRTLEEIPVNGVFIKRVRTGQYKTSPVSVARIVMELTQKTVYDIAQKGTELMVVFGGKLNRKPPALKDSPAEVPASDVKVIMPDAREKDPAPEEKAGSAALTLKPADVNRESAPLITPRKTAPRPASASKNIMETLSREPISFDYSEANVREVISMMAARAGINVIYTSDVSGSVTLTLNKVPFDEVFRTVLNVQGLAAQQVGDNILRIASPATFLAEEKKAFLQTRVFFLNYSKAADIKTQVDSVAAAEARKSNSIVDGANNALVVTDSATGLETTARLIRSLDRAPKQVMIEVKLVEVRLDSSFELGVDWSFSNTAQGLSGKISMPGPVPGGGTNAGSLTFGKLLGNTRFDAVIAAAVHKGKAKVLSDPKVATLNNKEATINITDQTYYKQETVSVTPSGPVTAVSYVQVPTGITLKVTPTINSDGRITMHLMPAVSQIVGAQTGTAPPNTATRSADTNVTVKDAETVVIGGLIQDSQSDDIFKIPILGDIPLIGTLFKKKVVSRIRKELLIFVTPRLIES